MPPLITDRAMWLLDSNHDLVVPIQWATGLTAVRQSIAIRLRKIKGEWFMDRDDGVPWVENDIVPARAALLAQHFNAIKARAALYRAIRGAYAVSRVLKLDIRFDGQTRTMSVRFAARTVWGDTVADELAMEV